MRWGDYVLAYDGAIPALWKAARATMRPVTFVLGAGFDPRALAGLRLYADCMTGQPVMVGIVELPGGQRDPRADALAATNAASLAAVAAAFAGSVEREGDRVEHGGLARAGGAIEQEQPTHAQLVEVDHLLGGERADCGEFEVVQPHQALSSARATASTALWMASRCSRVGSVLSTHSTNAAQISTGSTAS